MTATQRDDNEIQANVMRICIQVDYYLSRSVRHLVYYESFITYEATTQE